MKKYRRVTSHDTGEWCKVWGKTGSWFQKWHDVNLVNFNASSIRSENLHFDVLLFSIVFKVSAKKSAEELSLMILEKDPNFVKNSFCLKNDMRNLMSFNWSSEKSENLHFDGIFLSKVCNVWDKIVLVQTSCAVKGDLWFQKGHKDFGEFSRK